MRVQLLATMRVIICLLTAAACGNGERGLTPPNKATASACGANGTVQLAPLQGATIPCERGTISLTGNGASYLVVPNLAAQSVRNRPVRYTIGVEAAASGNRVPVAGPSLNVHPLARTGNLPEVLLHHRRQAAFDAALMNDARRQLARAAGGPASRQRSNASPPLRSTSPALGSVAVFHVLSSMNPDRYTRVSARLLFSGANIFLYVDTLAPRNGFTPAQLQNLAQRLDQTFYPIDQNVFGAPSDIDKNGHVIVLLSPVVNRLTPDACDPKNAEDDNILGFFNANDLVSTDTTSNQGEIIYAGVPDPSGVVGCAQRTEFVASGIPVTFLHEFQHLIDFAHHVVLNHGPAERGWLDEGLSLVAEELGSLHYENIYPPPTGRSNPVQLFPDSSQLFIIQMFMSYAYAFETDTVSVLFHTDADTSFNWRGGDWLLMRWLGDHEGTNFYQKLIDSHLTGTDNIANAAGEPFDGLFGDFSLSLYVDSLPGIPKSSIPVRDRFAVRNLRTIWNRLNEVGTEDPRVFPILPDTLRGMIDTTMVTGTMAYYLLNTTAGQDTVAIDFRVMSRAPLPHELHPQVSIFRLK